MGRVFEKTVLLRVDGTRMKKFQSNGVIPLLGSNDSHEIIEKAASQSDGHPSSRSIIGENVQNMVINFAIFLKVESIVP